MIPSAEGVFEPEGNIGIAAKGRGDAGLGGVFDHGTREEDGPVTWEALISPRENPVLRRTGDLISDVWLASLDRTKLKEMLQTRIADGSLQRLIGKCLHVGVLDGVEYSEPDRGTTQGSVLSPLLGNVYLHYVLDVWFEREVSLAFTGRPC